MQNEVEITFHIVKMDLRLEEVFVFLKHLPQLKCHLLGYMCLFNKVRIWYSMVVASCDSEGKSAVICGSQIFHTNDC